MQQVYLTNRPDLGIGAVAQCHLFCYGISKIRGAGFYFPGFSNLENFGDKASKAEYTKRWDEFFNLSSLNSDITQTVQIHLSVMEVMNLGQSLMRDFDITNYLRDLKRLIFYSPSINHFQSNKISVAIHIRQFMHGKDEDPDPVRECINLGNKELRQLFYQNLINKLLCYPNIDIHVFSSGEYENIKFLESFPLKIHNNEDTFSDMWHLINADILVMGNSSFSYVPHLLTSGVSLVRSNFYHTVYPSKSVFVDSRGNFDIGKVNELLQ